jgi:Mg-chelatase subunit ChlD
MSSHEQLYRMSLIGATAGFLSWAIGVWIPIWMTLPQEQYWLVELIEAGLIGFFFGVMCMAFDVHVTVKGLSWNSGLLIFGGAVLCCAAALLAVILFAFAIAEQLKGSPPWLITISEWSMVGVSIGFVIGFLKYRFLWRHLLFTTLGGAVGAIGGGILLALGGERIPYVTNGFGLVLMGLGIAYCSTKAVKLMGKGALTLELVEAACPESVVEYFKNRPQEWVILNGDRILFGKALQNEKAGRFVHVPDETMEDLHGYILQSEGKFYLEPHPSNLKPTHDGEPAPSRLRVKHPAKGASWIALEKDNLELEDGDLVQLGETYFRFHIRGISKRRNQAPRVIMLCLICLVSIRTADAQTSSQPAQTRLVPADKIRLLQCWPGSERPCFRLSLNVVASDGAAAQLPFYDPLRAVEQVKIYEDDTSLQVFRASLNADEDIALQRYAILLVDISGSMLQPASNGRTKFEVMKTACANFAESAVDGVDYIAIIPFESRSVVTRVNQAEFFSQKAHIKAAIDSLASPTQSANTGLFSATMAALERLQQIRKQFEATQSIDLQLLLLVMTDGNNDVGHTGDDESLLTDWGPVAKKADEAKIQLITIGFGNPKNLDRDILEKLAWPEKTNYLPAERPAELLAAFKKARSFQINRLQLYFFPSQTSRSQLIRSHQYKVRLEMSPENNVEGIFDWKQIAGITAPPFEGSLPEKLRPPQPPSMDLVWLCLYLIIVFTSPIWAYLLWSKLPRRIWAEDYDSSILRERALSVLSTAPKR